MTLEIANKLVEMRRARGVSQEELAAHLGVSRQAISKWERGEASPDIDNIILLSRFYGVGIDELLCCEGNFTEAEADNMAFAAEPAEPAEPAENAEEADSINEEAEPHAVPIPEDGARFASVSTVEVRARAYVTLFGVEGDEVSVALSGSKKEQGECSVYTEGSVLRIETPGRERLFNFFSARNTLKIALGLPRSIGRVTVELYGGDANVSNVKAKDLYIKTGGGNIESVNTRSKGLVLTTGGGDITVEASCADAAQIRTGGGEIKAEGIAVNGLAEFRTGGGDMDVSCSGKSVSAYSGGGDIALDAAADEIDAKSGGGDIDICGRGVKNVSAKTGGGDIETNLRGIKGATLSMSTAGGGASLRVNGNKVLSGKNIQTSVGDGSARVELRSGGGDISASIE